MDKRERKYLQALYFDELLHWKVYTRFAATERNAGIKALLTKLAKIELGHTKVWIELLDGEMKKPSELRLSLMAGMIYVCKAVLGIALTTKMIEYGENLLVNDLNSALKASGNRKESNRLMKAEEEMDRAEDPLKRGIIEHSPVLNNIRDVILGANDGLVEILAATAGLGIALRDPVIVLLSGFIVAVAGTLSMAGGVYLSMEYERSVGIVKTESPLKGSAKISAFYVGLSYILGAMVPLVPFMFGLAGAWGVLGSIVLTGIVLSFVAALISIVSDTSIRRRVLRTLAISLGIAAVTIIIGLVARSVLNIPYL
ncbi:MAG TPA: VIT1/CCC1 transporter family protein [Candidatus Acidoferrales bacterium]|nr:VIT1/CCC1 transporter family protein [Candidatus Acidoferrales bacterium]